MCNAFVASIASVLLLPSALAFAPASPCIAKRPSASALFSNNDSGEDGGIADFEKEKMNIVRMLQKSYYKDVPDTGDDQTMESTNNSATAASALDPATGRINNLPLWRVGWVETPGRRNCLNVHEMQYTHMFEKILSQENDGPLYFGHLYLPGGTTSAKSGEERYQLKTWRDELKDENRFDNYDSSSTLVTPDISTPTVDRSAVVGCLMQIIDHRRMEDGRLMLLIQALERFVVDEIVDTKPYAVANVQILLDKEELPWEDSQKSSKGKEVDENFCKYVRGKAVAASFYYHEYEFNRPKLPISENNDQVDESYLTSEDVPWTAISKLLPFAHYSTDEMCLNAANAKTAHVADSMTTLNDEDDNSIESTISSGGELPMEHELWSGGITWDPPPVPQVITRRSQDTLDCDTLETLLWLALDDFCRAAGFELPEEVRCLLPPEMDYLDIEQMDTSLSSNYPKIRRQRRLSYLAPALIENVENPMKDMRQVWLNTPSTAARLAGALERYEYLNNKMMGQYE
mmetsp:Transcript_10546/g.23369  ORF Transcript_10546/g.23369 Transcript_10546/m.23369 type:complete len:517 (-) Transcript_10546:60-1610(-)